MSFFLNDVLLRYLLKNKISIIYSISIDNYTKGLYDILENNNEFKNLPKEKKEYYTNFCKKVLRDEYDDNKTIYENFKQILKTINDINTTVSKTDKKYYSKIIMYIKRSQNYLRKAFQDNTYKKYGIPIIIFECINLERPIKRGNIIKVD